MCAVAALILGDLGVNLFADALALWFVLFVVDGVVEEVRRDEQAPARRAAARELAYLHASINMLLRGALECSVRLEDLPVLRRALTQTCAAELGEILGRIRMTDSSHTVSVSPDTLRPDAWNETLPSATADIRALVDRFIPRYVSVVPPEVLETLQRLERCSVFQWAEFVASGRVDRIGGLFWEDLVELNLALRDGLIDLVGATGQRDAGTAARLVDESILQGVEEGRLPRPQRAHIFEV